ALGLGQLGQLGADLGDGRALGKLGLALPGGGDEGTQFPRGKVIQVDRHQVLRSIEGNSPSVGNAIPRSLMQENTGGNECRVNNANGPIIHRDNRAAAYWPAVVQT